MREKEGYDTAQICLNGHTINDYATQFPEDNKPHCTECGERTTAACERCHHDIRGRYWPSMSLAAYIQPHFCQQCGEPYPWTERRLKAARDLSDVAEGLTQEERDTLKRSLDDIVRDTPQTIVAAARFKKLLARAGKGAAEGFRTILIDFVSETAKKAIWGP